MKASFVGWDLGGAHVKVALVQEGQVQRVWQKACPLWQGLDHLVLALKVIRQQLPPDCLHGLTMTGEMVDLFSTRSEGVQTLLRFFSESTKGQETFVFLDKNFIPLSFFYSKNQNTQEIASNNWQLVSHWLSKQIPDALLIDIGSTTTDLIPIVHHQSVHRGHNDHSRMLYGELIYQGVVRTALMALTKRVPFAGQWIPLMAEHFATAADIYRILDQLPSHVDQSDTADGGPKTIPASMKRLARMIGMDKEDAPDHSWMDLACVFREIQLQNITLACHRMLSSGMPHHVTLVGAGVGRFLLEEIARRVDLTYRDLDFYIPSVMRSKGFSAADCAPAATIALLLASRYIQQCFSFR